jgi:hypothetical protein
MAKRKLKDDPIPSIAKICPKVNHSAGLCGVCATPIFDWLKPVKECKDDQSILIDPWVRTGHYSEGSYSTWNPIFNDRRMYCKYCYKCWSEFSDYIMIADGFDYTGLHLVTTWSFEKNIIVKRSSGEIQDQNEFYTKQWNYKSVPEDDKTDQDKEKEKETIVYCLFNRFAGEFMIYVKLVKDGACKPILVSELQKFNPDLPKFQFRFPNRIPYYKVLQWANKQTEADHEKMQEYGWMSEWYNPDI